MDVAQRHAAMSEKRDSMAMGMLAQAEFTSLADVCLGMTGDQIVEKGCAIARDRAMRRRAREKLDALGEAHPVVALLTANDESQLRCEAEMAQRSAWHLANVCTGRAIRTTFGIRHGVRELQRDTA